MSETTSDTSRWIAAWRVAGARLNELRAAELAAVDVAAAIEMLEDAFLAARRHAAPATTSGLVAQQAWFMKSRT